MTGISASQSSSDGALCPVWNSAALAQVLTIEHNDSYLACRDDEKARLCRGIEASASQATSEGHIIYIFGQPGTGKTATVKAAWAALAAAPRHGQKTFAFHEINALSLSTPSALFLALHRTLLGRAARSMGRAFATLDAAFRGPGLKDRRHHVVLVDEFDNLIGCFGPAGGSDFHDRLYSLFDWPSLPRAQLTIICVANTLCLPQHLLPRCFSRLGLGQISFAPYSYHQLQQIIAARIPDPSLRDTVFEPRALELLCRRVAAITGDARKLLNLASSLVLEAQGRRITLEAVLQATATLYASNTVQFVASLPLAAQLLLLCLASIIISRTSSQPELGPGGCEGLHLYRRFCTEADLLQLGTVLCLSVAFSHSLATASEAGLVVTVPHTGQRVQQVDCITPARSVRRGAGAAARMEPDPSGRQPWGRMGVILIVPAAELVAGVKRGPMGQQQALRNLTSQIDEFNGDS